MNYQDRSPTSPASPAASGKSLSDHLSDARRRLVETGTRNRLIHVNRDAKRANALNVINERSDDIFELLKVKRRKMSFLAKGEDDAPDHAEELVLAGGREDGFDEGRYQDSFLETPLGPDALQKRLLKLFADAKTAEEEQGINILYLAMGFLKWFEDKSSAVPREAPLILVPVQLKRSERGSDFNLLVGDDDIVTNLPLHERLMGDFGLTLPEIDDNDDWAPSDYFDRVADAIEGREGWSIDRDGMQLGFFSFAKLLMLKDLDPENWPNASIFDNKLLRGVLKDGFAAEPPLFDDGVPLDSHLSPEDIIQVVDADASQTKVIEEVRAGRNMVVQGPPGTGKSQTITNIIASAVHDGKTVLFVAEKMAALDVVHSRLVKTGLRDACLELHSRSANKKAFLQELGRTLNAAKSAAPVAGTASELKDTRDRLNRIAATLHEPVPGASYSPFSAMAEVSGFFGKNTPAPKITVDKAETLDDAAVRRLSGLIADYAATLERIGPLREHPFHGVGNLILQLTDQQRLAQKLEAALAALTKLHDESTDAATRAGTAGPSTLDGMKSLLSLLEAADLAPEDEEECLGLLFDARHDKRLTEALTIGREWKEAQEKAASTFIENAFAAPVDHLRAGLAAGLGSIFSRWFGPYRKTSAELASFLKVALPGSAQERLDLLDRLTSIQRKRKLLAEDEPYLQRMLGQHFRGERTAFSSIWAVADWLNVLQGRMGDLDPETCRKLKSLKGMGHTYQNRIAPQIADCTELLSQILHDLQYTDIDGKDLAATDLARLREILERMQGSMPRYAEWTDAVHQVRDLKENGLSDFVSALDDGRLPGGRAVTEFRYAVAEARWNHALKNKRELPELSRLNRHQLVDVFQTLERNQFDQTAAKIRARHLAQLPTGAVGPMGFLRTEIGKKTRHRSIRKVMEAAGDMVQRIKPVLLMSPISVAQYLKPGKLEFDLLVIDEASQVRPEDAVGAIARCKQLVVVGDRKQLPPTSFFDRLSGNVPEEDDEDEVIETASAVELESILTACEARGLRSAMLEWHYRSRDPSLIQVSNIEFYENRLVLPPSPVQLDENYGLRFRRVEGAYSSKSRGGGRAGTNRVEAEQIAKAVVEHALSTPDLSLGIVAFSKAQADMISEVLELHRRTDETLDAFLREGRAEDVFIKNIENVQGDERDVILISVGYGPHEPNGRLASMNFGPVNGEGGERRLNVLFSRARVRCDVFCSFDPGDMDTRNAVRDGPRILKRFLEFAKSGQIEEKELTGLGPDSAFEEDVADVIRQLGYPVDYQVGSAGFRIDLGVRHPERPGQYVLAVECDGATYHSALWARERDRLRQGVLEGLGWTFHRIWSTDWFNRRTNEIARLKAALRKSCEDAAPGIRVAGANDGGVAVDPDEDQHDVDAGFVDLVPVELTADPYRKAQIAVRDTAEPHEVPLYRMADYVCAVVEQEGPVHADEVARRIATAFGKNKAGSRIRTAVETALGHARGNKGLREHEGFWFTAKQQDATPVRSRSAEGTPTNKAEYLSSFEIEAAADIVRKECGELDEDELVRSVCRLLGYLRAGPDLQARIRAVLS